VPERGVPGQHFLDLASHVRPDQEAIGRGGAGHVVRQRGDGRRRERLRRHEARADIGLFSADVGQQPVEDLKVGQRHVVEADKDVGELQDWGDEVHARPRVAVEDRRQADGVDRGVGMRRRRHLTHEAVHRQFVGDSLDPFVVEAVDFLRRLGRVADLPHQHRLREGLVDAQFEGHGDPEVPAAATSTRPPEVFVFLRLGIGGDGAQHAVRGDDVDGDEVIDAQAVGAGDETESAPEHEPRDADRRAAAADGDEPRVGVL
jgi:hypothetical protein